MDGPEKIRTGFLFFELEHSLPENKPKKKESGK